MIHPQHLISPLSLLRWLLHQTALVSCWVQIGQQLRVDEVLRLEDDHSKDWPLLLINDFFYSSRTENLYRKSKRQIRPRTYAVDHEVHDGLGHEVSDGLVDDADVGVHQVADGLHLALQLRVHGHGVARIHRIFVLRLEETQTEEEEEKTKWWFLCVWSLTAVRLYTCVYSN